MPLWGPLGKSYKNRIWSDGVLEYWVVKPARSSSPLVGGVERIALLLF